MEKTTDEDLIILLNSILQKDVIIDDYTQFIQAIAVKFLNHAKSLNHVISNGIDISSSIAILRAQLETYTTFYLLYKKGSYDECSLRYNLWKLDGLKQRAKFTLTPEDLPQEEALEILAQIEDEKKQIQELKLKISLLPFFEKLPKKYQQQFIKRAIWKFDLTKIEKGYKKFDYSIREMVENSNIKPIYINDMYSFFSMHSHTNYISVLQNQQMTSDFFSTVQSQLIDLSSILITQFIDCYLELFNLDINGFCDEKHVIIAYRKRMEK